MTLIRAVALFARKIMTKKKKCRNGVDRKMVKSLDSITWKDSGNTRLRNAINSKQKLGLGYNF